MSTSPSLFYKYKTMSISHLPELLAFMNDLKSRNLISDNKTFHRYIDYMEFNAPKDLPNAKSIVIMAVASQLGTIDIHHNSTVRKAFVPQNYYDMGPPIEKLIDIIQNDIIKEIGYNCVRTRLHLKMLAVRSGLAKYGRNNITYVDEMGSFYNLFAFFTDYEFAEDDWKEMEMLKYCKTCNICLNNCPTGAIRPQEMVIDVKKCLPLYNEIPGEIPDWINNKAHNALMGCMRCQAPCPGNKKAIQNLRKFDDISAKSVDLILNRADKDEFQRIFGPIFDIVDEEGVEYFFPVFKRNLEAFLQI
ncbi:4Fe-4S double cluster binding domain-containing protein [Candidatus Lokiarchaeum ossiferum]|uniref:4Fe-4S double cluster binding domain-containing protein n=1 Tax=Candidatus Lokiarchaeum ossiferum TaxID=2951803 RepID=UPI00352E7244